MKTRRLIPAAIAAALLLASAAPIYAVPSTNHVPPAGQAAGHSPQDDYQPTGANKNNPKGGGVPASGSSGPVCGNGEHTGNPHCGGTSSPPTSSTPPSTSPPAGPSSPPSSPPSSGSTPPGGNPPSSAPPSSSPSPSPSAASSPSTPSSSSPAPSSGTASDGGSGSSNGVSAPPSNVGTTSLPLGTRPITSLPTRPDGTRPTIPTITTNRAPRTGCLAPVNIGCTASGRG